MKAETTLTAILIIVVCVLGFSLFSSISHGEADRVAQQAQAKDREAALIDSLNTVQKNRENKLLDSIADSVEKKLAARDVKIKKLANQNKSATERADSAEARYNREFSKENCDSVIVAKNEVIKIQGQQIDSISVQASNYEDLVYVFKAKAANWESVVFTHEQSIKACRDNVKILNEQLNAEQKKIPGWMYAVAGFTGGVIVSAIIIK